MINPTKITNFDLDEHGLQENLLFWIAVAGKTARVIAQRLDVVLTKSRCYLPIKQREGASPFQVVRRVGRRLGPILRDNGIGCWNLKAQGMLYAAKSGLDLSSCSVDDLESIPGVGMKTSRCFTMHTRRDARCAGLDVHILKYMREQGLEVPIQTPGSKKKYLELEKRFLELADAAGKPVAEFDLEIWNQYSTRIESWEEAA